MKTLRITGPYGMNEKTRNNDSDNGTLVRRLFSPIPRSKFSNRSHSNTKNIQELCFLTFFPKLLKILSRKISKLLFTKLKDYSIVADRIT